MIKSKVVKKVIDGHKGDEEQLESDFQLSAKLTLHYRKLLTSKNRLIASLEVENELLRKRVQLLKTPLTEYETMAEELMIYKIPEESWRKLLLAKTFIGDDPSRSIPTIQSVAASDTNGLLIKRTD